MGQWVFEELRGAAVRRQPNEAVLFKAEQTNEGEYAGNDALVREILQNAVDASATGETVRVRLAIHDPTDAPPAPRLAYYFSRLQSPLQTRQLEFDAEGVPRIPCRFLVCEDFGTRGLEGDTELFRDPPAGDRTRQDFYWFWRNIGRSGKTGDDLGRWGLGKTVYRAVSRAGCMLGLTVRRSDRQPILMGQAVLHIHGHEGKEYLPEGYWCGTQNASGLPLPIDDPDELDCFRREWRLSRTDQPGLSVVAPFVPTELRSDRLLQAVIVHFFSHILRGRLIVEIVGPETGTVLLDQRSIEAACEQVRWDGPKRTKHHAAPPIAFTRRSLNTQPSVTTLVLGQERIPELIEKAFEPGDLAALRQRFHAGELTSVRVRLWLPKKRGGELGELDVHLERQDDGRRCDAYYIREGMTISRLNARAAQRGIQALVHVDGGPLAKLLGDTEGPAHEDWDTSAERPDQEWKTWKGRVKFVRGIVDSLVEILTPPTTEPDFDLLQDFFSIERTAGPQPQRKPGPGNGSSAALPPLSPVPNWYTIEDRSGGFRIGRNSARPIPPGVSLKVSVAYDMPHGDPLRNWNPLDFRIGNTQGDLIPSFRGVRATSRQANVVLLKQFQDDFSFSVNGFDKHRDLYIRVEELPRGDEDDR